MKWIFTILFLLIFLSASSVNVYAAAKSKGGGSFAVSGQFIKRANAVSAYFGNLKGVKSVSYTLMYESNGVGEGVMGSFSPGKKTAIAKSIYLGTCSGKICRPHGNIKNIQLEATVKYTNGKTATRTIKVK